MSASLGTDSDSARGTTHSMRRVLVDAIGCENTHEHFTGIQHLHQLRSSLPYPAVRDDEVAGDTSCGIMQATDPSTQCPQYNIEAEKYHKKKDRSITG
jgi:hypothetical protein